MKLIWNLLGEEHFLFIRFFFHIFLLPDFVFGSGFSRCNVLQTQNKTRRVEGGPDGNYEERG